MTSKPALTRLAAIGPPMMPRPTKPTVVIAEPPGCRSGSPRAGQPGEAVVAGPGGLVLEPDPAVVAGGGDPSQVAVEVDVAGAGLVAPRGVGDLDGGDTVAIGREHLVHE